MLKLYFLAVTIKVMLCYTYQGGFVGEKCWEKKIAFRNFAKYFTVVLRIFAKFFSVFLIPIFKILFCAFGDKLWFLAPPEKIPPNFSSSFFAKYFSREIFIREIIIRQNPPLHIYAILVWVSSRLQLACLRSSLLLGVCWSEGRWHCPR
jgi:hypothetical protein